MFNILIVEDEVKISNIISENLRKWGFNEKQINDNFDAFMTIFSGFSPHLVLMDINLPSHDGFYWCSKIREVSKVPIIFLSSRNSNMDIVMAMNMGGDDFVEKPFSVDVLMAKINALLRRTYSYKNDDTAILQIAGVNLNINDSVVSFKNQKAELTKNELRILQLLMKNKGKIISRDIIMQNLWESESFIDDNTLTVNITRLRKKIDSLGIEGFIQTRKGQGYMIL